MSTSPVPTALGNAVDGRRSNRRHSALLECAWSGAAGFSPTRISDISVSGCYVDSSQVPAKGEIVEITVSLDDASQVLTGQVVHSQVGMGFAVRFGPLSDSVQQSLNAFLLTH